MDMPVSVVPFQPADMVYEFNGKIAYWGVKASSLTCSYIEQMSDSVRCLSMGTFT